MKHVSILNLLVTRYKTNGERTYKLAYRHKNSRPQYVFHGATMYPNPFLVITPTGYTKHYYAGTERIAAHIGKGRFANVNSSVCDPRDTQDKLTEVNGIATYLVSYASPKFTYLNTLPILSTTQKEIYYYHTDHLGSSAWITDSLGVAVQHLAYLPWGEPYVTQKTGNFNPTYTFSGKERDEETGYSYFGQRFYDSQLSIWLSADPMRGKYPSLSPFVYCANNPVRLVDPNGMEIDDYYNLYGILIKHTDNGNAKFLVLTTKNRMKDSDHVIIPPSNETVDKMESLYNKEVENGFAVDTHGNSSVIIEGTSNSISPEQWQPAIDDIRSKEGSIDYLVHNHPANFSNDFINNIVPSDKDLNSANFHNSNIGVILGFNLENESTSTHSFQFSSNSGNQFISNNKYRKEISFYFNNSNQSDYVHVSFKTFKKTIQNLNK